jgi:2-oxoglutarate ferredoxin oxidoreductase subunit delta
MTTKDDQASGRSPRRDRESAGSQERSDKARDVSAAETAATPAVARQWRYPSADEHPDDEIFIYDKWCKSCGICYSVCPKAVLSSDKAGRPVVAHPEACIACGLCEVLCPDMAITVYKKRGAEGESRGAKGTADRGESGGKRGAKRAGGAGDARDRQGAGNE